MDTTEKLSRKHVRQLGEQLANDRKLGILSYAADRERFTVSELKSALDIPHSTAHEYCRDLQGAGLLERVQEKPAAYAPVDFTFELSLDTIVTAVESESQTLDYATARYGEEIVDEVIDIWTEIDDGDLTFREASSELGMDHADFLRVASELDLLS